MKKSKVNIRQIALPIEHGSWGFVLEPLILSLIVAYSFPGLLLAVCTFFMFLSHQPIKILFKNKPDDYNKKIAIFFLIIYLLVILVLFVFVLLSVKLQSLIPFGLSLVVMIIYLSNLYNQKNRELINELSAPISISLLVLSILLFKNWQLEYVISFWIILLSRSVQTTFYVHTKLLMYKKKKYNLSVSIIISVFFTLLLIILAKLKLAPSLAYFASILLFFRTVWGLFVTKNHFKVKTFGILEFVYGATYLALVALGYYLKI